MQLQTFQGSTMAEALQRVKSTLGLDAVIYHTRTLNHRKWMGLKKVELVEITAGRNAIQRQLPARPAPNPAAQQQQQRPLSRMPAGRPAPVPAPAPAATSTKDNVRALLESPAGTNAVIKGISSEMSQLKEMVSDLVTEVRKKQAPEVPAEVFEYYSSLIANMVAENLAAEIARSLQRQLRPEMLSNKAVVREKLAEHLEQLIPTAPPIERTKTVGPHVVALIGPTGVGKTTTVAKLAANLKLREKKKVGLITIDTFRIGAVDQLRRYADILGAPLKVVGSAEEMKAAIEGMAHFDFILIDTAGRSPKDSLKLVELKRFLAFAEPDEVYLVLSTTASENVVELAMEKFAEVRVDKLIFTKLDEVQQLGVVLNVARKINKGLAYVTTGQDVPDDIEVSHGKKLANLILGSS
ncbi:MAG: flagellar biosynthesis protein FlhF [Tepidisphaeraceae bacterium]